MAMGKILYPKSTRSTNLLLKSDFHNNVISNYVDSGMVRDEASYVEIEKNAKAFILK